MTILNDIVAKKLVEEDQEKLLALLINQYYMN